MPAPAGNDHYDVLVVGSGPGGATTAARVAETGRRVLLLERGDFLPRERDNWSSQAVFGDAKYTADETFYDLHDRPFRPELHYYVGGNSKVYGAALFRLLPADFGEVQHPNGVAPAWPLSYQDLEPYYVRAEHLFWVHGQHGEDPFAGISSQDYKYPPVRHEHRIQQLSDGLEQLGLHPFHLPLGVQLTQDAHGRATTDSHCIRCDRVERVPLPARRQGRRRMGRGPPGPGRASQSGLDDENDCRAPADRQQRPFRQWRGGHAPGRLSARVHRRHRRAVRGGHPIGCPAAEVSQRQASTWPGEFVRYGRPELHATQQSCAHRVLARTQPDGVPENAGAQRLLRSRRALAVPDGPHPDARQVR